MKTIELVNESLWFIECDDPTEKNELVLPDNSYSNLEIISISNDSEGNCLYFEGQKIDVPNLKSIVLSGKGSLQCFQYFLNHVFNNTFIEEIYFDRTGIDLIPKFILNFSTLKILKFQSEPFKRIPENVFELQNLETLSFEYCCEIKVIPDKIKNLKGLKYFGLWAVTIDYMSPELFYLPRIESMNFFKSKYFPTLQILDLLKIFKGGNGEVNYMWENLVM